VARFCPVFEIFFEESANAIGRGSSFEERFNAARICSARKPFGLPDKSSTILSMT